MRKDDTSGAFLAFYVRRVHSRVRATSTMCILASPVKSVSNTMIYTAANEGKTRQLVVYAMSIKLGGRGNAMILPCPTGVVQLVDLSKAKDFFTPLVDAFTERTRSLRPVDASFSLKSLAVHRVGSYDVSIVPTVDDVKRVDTSTFTLSPETETVLRKHYPVGFSFVVARLRESGEFHPLAYTCPMSGRFLFVPTRHEHGGRGMPSWDHSIFYPGVSKPVLESSRARGTISPRSVRAEQVAPRLHAKTPALTAYLGNVSWISRMHAEGTLPNVDLSIPV